MTKFEELHEKAKWIWRETLLINQQSPETRISSSLSPIEIFVTLFYGNIIKHFPSNPLHEDRDRLIISKGHGSISLYPILADFNYFGKEELSNVGKKGSFLGGIPDPVIPGYETVNGSLGHGLGVGTGIAYALKKKGNPQSVFVICGDGELHEGANWEAIMFAAHHRLDNLTLIVDDNHISMLGNTDEIVSHGCLEARFRSFGWLAKTVNGHSIKELYVALKDEDKKYKENKPKVILANTVKGRGIPGIENQQLSHVMTPGADLLKELLDQQK